MFISAQTTVDNVLSLVSDLKNLTVADFGCGSGEHVLELAKKMGGEGRVYAIDVQKPLLDRVSVEAGARGYNNVITVWSDVEQIGATKIPEASIDVAFVCNVLFQVEDQAAFIKEVSRLLKSGGLIVVVDWVDSFDGMGPQPDQVLSLEQAQDMLRLEGFTINNSIKGSSHHYVIVGKS